MLTKKQYKALTKKQLIKMNKNQRGMIVTYKNKADILHVQLEASIKTEARTEQHIISCENANNELHDRLECYREVLRDIQ